MTETRISLQLPDEKGEGLWCLAFWLMVAASVVLHVLQLDARPLHHDEAVNGWFLDNMMNGTGWRYDPTNYHGPFLYYFHTMLAGWTGISEAGLRMPVAVASALLPALLVGFRHWMGWSGLFFCAALLTASPAMLYYGRTFIHETYLAIALVMFLVVAHRFALWRMTADWLAMWAILALIMAIKETGIISVAIMAIAAVMADAVASLLNREKPKTLAYMARMLPPGDGQKRVLSIVLGLVVWQILLILYFTNFGSHKQGWLDIWRAYAVWFETGHGSAHNQPFWHYLTDILAPQQIGSKWMMQEAPIVVLGSIAALYSLYRKSRLGLFLAAWTAGTFLAYSMTPYKTPWLVVQIILPMALLAGWGLGHLWVYLAIRNRELVAFPLLLVAAAPIGWMANDAARLAFIDFDEHRNPYIYAHTNKEVAPFLDMINDMGEDPELRDTRLAVMAAGLWPMPWYVRSWTAKGFWERKIDPTTRRPDAEDDGWPDKITDDLMMVSREGRRNHQLREAVQVLDAEKLLTGDWKRRDVLLRPGLPTYLYLNPESEDRLMPIFERYGMADGWEVRENLGAVVEPEQPEVSPLEPLPLVPEEAGSPVEEGAVTPDGSVEEALDNASMVGTPSATGSDQDDTGFATPFVTPQGDTDMPEPFVTPDLAPGQQFDPPLQTPEPDASREG